MAVATVATATVTVSHFISDLRSFVKPKLARLRKDLGKFLLSKKGILATFTQQDIETICSETCDIVDCDTIRKAWAYATGLIPQELYESHATYKWYEKADFATKQVIDQTFVSNTPIPVRASPTAAPKFVLPSDMTSTQLNVWKPSKAQQIRPLDLQATPVVEPFNYPRVTSIEVDPKLPTRILLRSDRFVMTIDNRGIFDSIVAMGKTLGW